MDIPTFLERHVSDRTLGVVPIGLEHLVACDDLPLHHKDPFDRMIAAQAKSLGLPVATSDPTFPSYGIKTIW
ncbi:MAG: type II toxin-antitoxin system VapC family toxin [Deltaproteobacteria bacterium]|nr:type II toxin-antitoxin system VapC family toxin [Deltaproteobacteria bacterium]